jgi:hypothetical protein
MTTKKECNCEKDGFLGAVWSGDCPFHKEVMNPKVEWNEDSMQELHKQLNEIRSAVVLMYYVSAKAADSEQLQKLYRLIAGFSRYSINLTNHD